MSEMDNIFDVRDALKKNKHAKKAFKELEDWIWSMQSDNEQLRKENRAFREVIKVVTPHKCFICEDLIAEPEEEYCYRMHQMCSDKCWEKYMAMPEKSA
jgi:hypothetical protein